MPAIPAIIAGGAAIGGALIGKSATNKAAETQFDATRYAADLQKQSSDQALQFQKDTFAKQQENIAPWLQAGTSSLSQLSGLLQPGGDLTKPFQFSGADFTGDPGYQFRLQQGQQAIERAASSRGSLLGGGTGKALSRYTQDYASNEYDRAYNRAFNTFETNQGNLFNRLSSLAGTGQQAVSLLGSEGSQNASNVENNLLTTGNRLADLATQGGNARASGYVGGANAWANGLGGLANTANQYAFMNLLRPRVPAGTGINPLYRDNNLGDYNGAGPGLPPAVTPSQNSFADYSNYDY